jgi:hypothetical protein
VATIAVSFNDFLGGGDLVRVSHRSLDFLDRNSDFLDLDFGNGFGNNGFGNNGFGNNGSNGSSSENGILVLFGGFMTRTVALVSSAIAGPSSTAKGALSDRAIRKLTRLTRFANVLNLLRHC